MATAARFNRKVAPKAPTKTEAPVTTTPKASIWTRVKTAAKKVATTIAKPFKAIAKKAAPVAKKTATTIAKPFKAIAKKIGPTAKKVAFIVALRAKQVATKVAFVARKFWTLSLQPLLVAMMIAFGVTAPLVAVAIVPLQTVLVCLAGTAVFFGLAHLIKKLEMSPRWIAYATLVALEVIAQVVRAIAYVVTAVLVLALCTVSIPFAIFAILDMALSYFEVRGGTTIAFLVSCVAAGNWAMIGLWIMWRAMRGGKIVDAVDHGTHVSFTASTVPAYSEIRRKPVTVSDVRIKTDIRPSDAPNNPELWTRGNFLVATGTEELWGTEFDVPPVHDACGACGTRERTLRVRSMNVPFATSGSNKGTPREEGPRDMLCTECFTAECEDVALALTGVSLDARAVEVRLNKTGIEHSPEHSMSLYSPEEFKWLVSGWWRDKNGRQYDEMGEPFDREHTCLLDGKVVATVEKDRRRNVYRATVLGKLIDHGVTKSLVAAKEAAIDALNDERNAVERYTDAAETADGDRKPHKARA